MWIQCNTNPPSRSEICLILMQPYALQQRIFQLDRINTFLLR